MDIEEIKFSSHGLVPAITQDAVTGEVLMLAYMNLGSLTKTLETRRVHYYSRSRQELWLKGETSGNFQELKAIYYDCDCDTLLLKIEQIGEGACHTGERSCFYRRLDDESDGAINEGAAILPILAKIIEGRKEADSKSSYVASLFKGGRELINSKVAEESGELIEAANLGVKKDIIHEAADLWFHSMVLLSNEGISMEDLFDEFARRFGTSGVEEKKSRAKKG
ncbi:MAG: bifunctional phosphoribosyl-AMP cyclohydrolase/phosphoribosyl-ATP diphosphatase HisIE [Proteobacteria bacterium]|nr:bifunctional phosphoribosyl-AMP cyclohydrolase/phosphoribosyl-ATP diphosphatase HisIE [Pseudomonadota bacterium]